MDKILKSVKETKVAGSDIVCFSELTTCAYPPRDFLEFKDFIIRAKKSIERLTKAVDDIAIVVGSHLIYRQTKRSS